MISGVTVTALGEAHTFRLSARAIMALEDQFDKSIDEIMQALRASGRVTMIMHVFAAMANDGRGMDLDAATDVFDALGFTAAMQVFEEAAARAFPEADQAGATDGKVSSEKKKGPARK